GLVGDLKNPKIYGAGLLSSLSESFHCFDRAVKKLPFDLNCIQQHYDITKPQPQLFVTPNFEALGVVLEQFARTMAFKTGGITGLQKAQRSRAVCTVELDSGVQIGGKLVETLCARDGSPAYLRFEGPCQLAIREKELKGHGVARHPQGFGCPVGPIESERKLSTGKTEITFVSGVKILGVPKPGARGFVKTFTDCKVQWGDRILFEPAWGEYDWVRGNTIKSVFGHAPDRSSYVASMGGYTQRPSKPKTNLTKENAELNVLYAEVRAFRESVLRKKASLANLPEATGVRLDRVVEKLDRKYPRDWLLRLELLEIAGYLDAKASNGHRVQSWIGNINKRLDEIARGSVEKAEMIARGRELLADASALSKGAA
ncbi:MAG TPA: hypothetical protein PLH57_02365, partial [Oligoflexia bacterium]|nr:hypothetical protein [Oligoflexia bacterium]